MRLLVGITIHSMVGPYFELPDQAIILLEIIAPVNKNDWIVTIHLATNSKFQVVSHCAWTSVEWLKMYYKMKDTKYIKHILLYYSKTRHTSRRVIFLLFYSTWSRKSVVYRVRTRHWFQYVCYKWFIYTYYISQFYISCLLPTFHTLGSFDKLCNMIF